MDMSTWEFWMLDVLSVVFGITVIILGVLYCAVSFIVRRICSGEKQKQQ